MRLRYRLVTRRCLTFQVFLGDLQQSVLWPFAEPVDGHAVDECRVLPDPVSERFAYRTHTQYHVQVGSHSVYEEREYRLRRVLNVLLLRLICQSVPDLQSHNLIGQRSQVKSHLVYQ